MCAVGRACASPLSELPLAWSEEQPNFGYVPVLSDASPADGDTNVALGSDIVIDFSENVAFGASGTITVRARRHGGEGGRTGRAGSVSSGDDQQLRQAALVTRSRSM